jgi:uncharacterized protein YqgV (UPF0045/DUF77 family)
MLCSDPWNLIWVMPAEGHTWHILLVFKLLPDAGGGFLFCPVGPMETTMEGELDRLLEIVREAQQVCAAAGAERILSVVKIDYSTKGVTIDEKVGKYRQAQPAQP